MADSSGDKKHLPSQRRLDKAKQDGQIAKSTDLTSATLLLAALATLRIIGGRTADVITRSVRHAMDEPLLGTFDHQTATNYLLRLALVVATAAAPILILMLFGGVAINVVQTGLILSPAKLQPKLSNVSPLSGAKRIFSLRGVMRLSFGLFKVLIISVVAYAALRIHRSEVLAMAAMSVPQLAASMCRVLLGVCLWIGIGLFILALLEYSFQRWKFQQDMMMTDQEVRDEAKESEGDPQLKARRRQIARQIAMNQIGQDVPKADVVVSNPTELAIAIQYDPKAMPAPIVVAKGAGVLAQRIRRVALENSIPVVERKPLAQVLYKTVEVGEEIPPDHYQAVAEVLRYVYQLQGKEIPNAA